MKLIIQIPCYNEEQTLPDTLADLPRQVEGFDSVQWLIINDGSSDRTVEVARAHGVDHIVSFSTNRGLAAGFLAGLDAAVKAGADVIVNTDADNQYNAADIPALCKPIIDGQAEIVVGARPIAETKHFSPTKRFLQKLGSKVVRLASKTDVADAPSGFRAISREAALRLNVFNEYTYTLETIIQAGQKGMAIASVPIRTNGPTRPSRLVKSIRSYVQRSIATIFRIFVIYRPLKFFLWMGTPPFVLGVALMLRWLALYFFDDPTRARTPSLIVAAVLVLIGFQLWCFALLADLLATNRKLGEELQYRLRRIEADNAAQRTDSDRANVSTHADTHAASPLGHAVVEHRQSDEDKR